LLVIPFPDNSLGGRWIGYLLLMLSGTTLAIGAALTVTMWKYGVDQTLRVINFFRSRSRHDEESNPSQYFTENVKSTL
jgi:hypothetical protein